MPVQGSALALLLSREVDELPRGEVDGDGVVRGLGGVAVAGGMVLDAQLRCGGDDAQVAVVLVVVVLQADLVAGAEAGWTTTGVRSVGWPLVPSLARPWPPPPATR